MIFADWGGEEYDNSYPPVRWPRAMRTPGTELAVTITSDEMPETVELRMWKELRRNGIPRGKRHYLQCYPALVAAPGECTIEPNLAGSQTAWNVAFQPPWRGRLYLAISAMWPDGQVAWINHALLK
jgi:hypothetical protein